MNFAGKLCFPILPQGSVKRSGFGWGGRIRTYAMLESESNALPLGDTPSRLKIMG